MTISTVASLIAKYGAPSETKWFQKSAVGPTTAMLISNWTNVAGTEPGTTPSTAIATDRTTAGALGQVNSVSSALRFVRAAHAQGSNFTIANVFLVCDRLSHQGGLSGTVTTAQTTNLPTAALTRYTNGLGVQMAFEMYAAVGTTATTATVSYTNEAGTAGRTSDPIPFGGNNFREIYRFLPITLQQGDLGVKSVESVTVTASTGTAGNFGVTLYRPLFPVIYSLGDYLNESSPFHDYGGLGMEEIVDDACLFFLANGNTGIATPISGLLKFAED